MVEACPKISREWHIGKKLCMGLMLNCWRRRIYHIVMDVNWGRGPYLEINVIAEFLCDKALELGSLMVEGLIYIMGFKGVKEIVPSPLRCLVSTKVMVCDVLVFVRVWPLHVEDVIVIEGRKDLRVWMLEARGHWDWRHTSYFWRLDGLLNWKYSKVWGICITFGLEALKTEKLLCRLLLF